MRKLMTRWRHLSARCTENLLTLTVLDGFGLSHVLRALSHAGATVGHPCILPSNFLSVTIFREVLFQITSLFNSSSPYCHLKIHLNHYCSTHNVRVCSYIVWFRFAICKNAVLFSYCTGAVSGGYRC